MIFTSHDSYMKNKGPSLRQCRKPVVQIKIHLFMFQLQFLHLLKYIYIYILILDIIIIYSLKPPQVRKTYYIVYYIHTNVSQVRNITVYVLKAGQ